MIHRVRFRAHVTVSPNRILWRYGARANVMQRPVRLSQRAAYVFTCYQNARVNDDITAPRLVRAPLAHDTGTRLPIVAVLRFIVHFHRGQDTSGPLT